MSKILGNGTYVCMNDHLTGGGSKTDYAMSAGCGDWKLPNWTPDSNAKLTEHAVISCIVRKHHKGHMSARPPEIARMIPPLPLARLIFCNAHCCAVHGHAVSHVTFSGDWS